MREKKFNKKIKKLTKINQIKWYGMVFKPSFKCFKNEKIIFIQVILKTRMFVLSEYVYIISSYIIFVRRFRLTKKKWSNSLKNMPLFKI